MPGLQVFRTRQYGNRNTWILSSDWRGESQQGDSKCPSILFWRSKCLCGYQIFKEFCMLMEGVKTWLSSQAADFFDTGKGKKVKLSL
jgi:hypothetical protein